jgi:uncharacterized protein (TIGR02757 family)
MTSRELKEFLDEKAAYYNHPRFVKSDPIQIPHRFDKKEDIEISAFLTAVIAWGNRKSIINNAERMMTLMGNSPFDFVMNHSKEDLKDLSRFVHRTFNGDDLQYFIISLQNLYKHHRGLEAVFSRDPHATFLYDSIHEFKKTFFELPHLTRTQKHISDPLKNSAAKRMNMYLRWMVRHNSTQVDFGIWKTLSPKQLSCPLDVHTGNVARKLGLIDRNQNDLKSLMQLDFQLRNFDPSDPVKYDFALFGLGVFEKF